MTVAHTALWILLAAPSLAAIVWLTGMSWEELDRHRRRMLDAPRTLRETPDIVFAAGVGLGAVAALAVLGAVAVILASMA